jgi:1,2-diacylglycerol 3-beta-galactosyltransferase
MKNGLDPSKVILRGLPVRPSFWKPSSPKSVIRKQLGLDQSRKTVLLMGGGDGVGGIEHIAIQLGRSLKEINMSSQLIVICGHNKVMADSLSVKLKPEDKQLKVSIKGFVNNVDQYMSASDCLVTKAGPGTIAESMIRGLPLVLSYYLPGQVTQIEIRLFIIFS